MNVEWNVEWTSEDSELATSEGWDIFECSEFPSTHCSGLWQIQKIDEAYIFDNDIDVWEFICKIDNELHRKALSFIKQKNKKEYELIMNKMNKMDEDKMNKMDEIPETNTIPTFISDATKQRWKVSVKKDDPRGSEYGYYDAYIDKAYPELIRIDKLDFDGELDFALLIHPDYFYNWSRSNT